GAIWKVSLDGGSPEKMDIPFGDVGFSSDGKLMFKGVESLEGGNFRASLIITPTAGGPPLHTFDVPYGMKGVRFTPDDKGISFLLTRDRATNVWVQPLSGGAPYQVTKFPSGDMFAFAWSHDGKQLAFSRGQRKTDVVMMSNFR